MSRFRAIHLSAVSVLALCAAPAFAQEAAAAATAPATDAGEVVITAGLRGSLASAQAIRRNATDVVDSIVAEDIGKFPDNTVADSLQRVTGVQVSRGRGETGGVDIRGLPNIATLIDGREVFTGTGRGVALQDIPAELLAGVDVYKTTSPDMVEGGLVGTVDIRLHRPFDFNGLQVAGSGRAIYSDQRKKWSYLGGGLVSDRWDTDAGEFGVLLGGSYNKRLYRDDTAFDFVYSGAPTPTPDTVGGLLTVGDRRRTAFNGSMQWKPNSDIEFYTDGLYTQYKETWGVNFFIGLPKAGNVTAVTTRSDGSGLAQSATTINAYTLTSKQAFQNKTTTWQADFGTKWHVADNTMLTSEAVFNHSRIPNRNIIVDTSFNAPSMNIDFDVGGTPHVDITGTDLTNASNFYIRTLFDNHSVDTSRQFAWRADLQHDFGDGFLKNIKVGGRYTSRRATSQATASIPIGNPDPNGTPVSSVPGFAELSPGGLVNGKLGVDRFVIGNENWMLAHPDQIRAVFNQPSGDRPFEPTLAFFDDEKTYAAYAQLSYGFDLGSIPVDGTAGVRAVKTDEHLHGNGVDGNSSYWNYLPSATLRAKLSDQFQARFAFSQTINRPDFSALNPLVTYVPSGTTGTQTYAGTGGGGNPDLKSVKSTGFDAALEYYLSRSSSITGTVFYHKLHGYIQVYGAAEPHGTDTNGNPTNYFVTRPRNTGDGKLYGVELAWQQFFDFLPGALSGFGVQANGSYLVGTTEGAITLQQERLNQLSKYSYNVVAMYEKYGLTARLAYNWRSSYIDSTNNGGSQGSIIRVQPIRQLDFSGSYDVTKWLTLTMDATNLLDRTYHDRFTGPSLTSGVVSNTPRDTRTYDRTFEIGARVRF